MPPDESQSPSIFLQELKDQLQRYVAIKKGLDTKANSLITTTGIISIIFVGFGTFIITETSSGEDVWLVLLGVVLIFEVSITVLAIKSASDAYKARKYRQPIVYNMFFDRKNNRINEEMVRHFMVAKPDSLYENLIREYIACIKSHQQQNNMQVKDIERAQKIFYVALSSIPIFVGLAVFSGIVFG